MSLFKAIEHNKEHRKKYKGGKACSRHCENHGGRRHQLECEYCRNNRLYKNKKREQQYEEINYR